LSVFVTESSGISVSGSDLAFSFDPNVFSFVSVTAGAIADGSIGGATPFSILAQEVSPGVVRVTGSSPNGPNLAFNSTNTLYIVHLTVKANATLGTARFNLQATDGQFRTLMNDNVPQELTLSPAPTNGNTDDVDGAFTVQAGAQPHLFVNTNIPASIGQPVS